MDINDMIKYWVRSAEENLKTAKSLFKTKRYSHCLFFCHLFIEKILKALATKNIGKPAPYGHNLLKFAEMSGIKFSKTQLDLFDEINTFNIEARYNDYKFQFYKKATKKYSQEYFEKAEKFYLWLKNQI
jgi:HEPN domain-containing protein